MLEKMKLEKGSPIPLYYQLKEIIKSEIESGEWNQGDLIPSEREMVQVCKISRPTVRQAINDLVNEGLLMRQKGHGTFVSKTKVDQWFLESMLSFSKEMNMKGVAHSTKVLSQTVVATNPLLKSVFGEQYYQFICLERLRYVEGQPAVVVTSYIPSPIAPGLEIENLNEESLYDLIENKYGHRVSHATRVLESINVSEKDSELLEVEPMAAIQLIKTTGYLTDNQPFEYSIARYRGDSNSFTVTLRYQRT